MSSDEIWLSGADYAVAIVILLVPLAIGIGYAIRDANRATRTEYLLGGRQMSILPVATSTFISFLSGIALIGIPAEVNFFGFIYVLLAIPYSISYVIGYFTVVPLLYPLHITSVYEYLNLRYKSESLRTLSTCIGQLAQVFYMAITILSPALALQACANVPLWMSIFVIGLLGTLYTAIGGIKSVIWTDAFQTLVVFIGVFFIITKACVDVGGLGEVWRLAEEGGRINFNKFSLDPRARHTIWSIHIGFTVGRLVVQFNQSTIQRICCMKSLSDAKKMFLLNIPFTVVFDTVLALTGLAIYAYFHKMGCDPYKAGIIGNRNQITPYFVLHSMANLPGMTGFFIALLCCGSLSTLSSGINSLAANTTEDLLRKFLHKFKESTITFITKVIAAFYGCLIVGLSYMSSSFDGPVNQMVGTSMACLGSPLTGVFLLSGLLPWVNKYGAFAGIAIATTFNLWVGMGSVVQGIKYPTLPSTGTHGCENGTVMVNYSNATGSAIQGNSQSERFFLYDISYEWYNVMGVIVCVSVHLLVSYITNRYLSTVEDDWTYTDSKYIFPWARRFWGMADPIEEALNHTQGSIVSYKPKTEPIRDEKL